MVDGNEVVGGEVWTVSERWFPETLESLDRLEGYQQGDDDLYIRRIVECQVGDETIKAHTYFFNQPVTEYEKILPNENGIVTWSGNR